MAVDSVRNNLPATAAQRAQGVRATQPVLNAVAKSDSRAGDIAAMRKVFAVPTATANATPSSSQSATPRGSYVDFLA